MCFMQEVLPCSQTVTGFMKGPCTTLGHKGRMESMIVCTVLSLINSCQPQRQSPLPYIVDSTVVLSTMTLLGMLKPTQNVLRSQKH